MTDHFEDILVIDDVISPRYQEHLKQTVMDSKFPWYFNRDITSPLWYWEQNKLNDSKLDVEDASFTGFMHILWGREGKESEMYDIFVPLLYSMEEKIPSVIHVDNTCRIQTVTEEQNEHYYKLIDAFHKITDVPILFNTSFNLGGEPLVETIYDALETLEHSEIEYMYLPEIQKLVKVPNKSDD